MRKNFNLLWILFFALLGCKTEQSKDSKNLTSQEIRQKMSFPDDFVWGTATAAYQIEGGYQADGKGASIWDTYTNEHHITFFLTGEKQTANTAINHYDRKQYLQDIQLMKQAGIRSYRFSVAWSRILPEGIGEINPKGVAYYDQLIDDLLAHDIEPVLTIYHWDLPQKLADKGGWTNPKSVDWYANYANIIFDKYGDRVKKFITFNEPFINQLFLEPLIQQGINHEIPQFPPSERSFTKNVKNVHHWMIAHAKAVQNYRQKQLGGTIGITLSISPVYPKTQSTEDFLAMKRTDGIHNRWFLDAVLKGEYPTDILQLYRTIEPLEFLPKDMSLLRNNPPDFIGINYYAPTRVQWDEDESFGIELLPNPDDNQAFNGEVYPEGLYDALMKIKTNYGNPVVYITENGAGFGKKDDQIRDGKIYDNLRCDYIREHLAQANRAIQNGANLKGYYLWSFFDNFEWVFGFDRRFGVVHVDFETQKRTPKQSFYEYAKIIKKQDLKMPL